MVDALKTVLPHPASAAVLVDCPVPEVRTAVLSKVFADAGLSELDGLDSLDQRWVDEIRSVYLGDTWNWRHPSWATRDYTRQRQMLAWIDRHGGEGGLDLALVKERLNVADPELYFLLSTDVSKYLQKRAGSWAPLEFVHAHAKHTTTPDGSHRLVRFRQCPHCANRGPGQILRIPELPRVGCVARVSRHRARP